SPSTPNPVASKVDLNRSQAASVQTIQVATADASVYQITVHDQLNPITLAIENGKALTAGVGDVMIGQHAAIQLGDGGSGHVGLLAAPTSKTVMLQDGGMLKGNGTVAAGSLTVANGTVSPGFLVGHLDVSGGYNQQANGALAVDVTDSAGSNNGGQHDTI